MADLIIPQSPTKAIAKIIAMDDLQLSTGVGGGQTHRWGDWHWLQADSEKWTTFRVIVEPLQQAYINKKSISTEQRNLVKETILAARNYSNNDVDGHRLFLKIAAHGDNHDWTIAEIKYGTPLAKKPGKAKSDSPEMLMPTTNVKKNAKGIMQLRVFCGDTPKSTKLPERMKFAKVYRCIGTVAPTSIDEFAFYGNAKRGKLLVDFAGVDVSGSTKIYAWFFARYESNKGELGLPGEWEFAEILS